MRYLVTGGAGFIGSHVVEELVKKGQYITVIDNLATGKKERLAPFMDQIRFVQGDVRDDDLLNREMKGVDYVIHLAALISVVESVEQPELYRDVNVNGTRKLLEVAKRYGVKCFVVPSSCAAYGDLKKQPFKESMAPKPASPYGENKLEIERLCKEYYEKYGLRTFALRFFNVYGPRQDPKSAYAGVISIFIQKIINGEAPTIFGNGKQTRDFIYVKDIVAIVLKACKAEKGFGDFYNIGSEKEISVNDIFKMISKLVKKDIKPVYAPARKGEIKRALSDCSKAKKVLGFSTKYKFEEGLKETVNWMKGQR